MIFFFNKRYPIYEGIDEATNIKDFRMIVIIHFSCEIMLWIVEKNNN